MKNPALNGPSYAWRHSALWALSIPFRPPGLARIAARIQLVPPPLLQLHSVWGSCNKCSTFAEDSRVAVP